MNSYTLLSLSAFALSFGVFVGLTTFYALPALLRRNRQSIATDFIAEKVFFIKKDDRPKVFIPRMLARWPWRTRINPHHAVVTKESEAWMTSLGALSPKAQRAFNICQHSHVASLTYPMASKEQLRVCCDFMNMAFLVDEYSEFATGPAEVQQLQDITMDALRNPHKPRPKGEWIGGEMIRQFWESAIPIASERCQKRFITGFNDYFDGAVRQAAYRHRNQICDIKSYINIRRDTIGMKVSYALLELGLDIPEEVMAHPAIQEMYFASIDMIYIGNDLVSYNVEQSRGEDEHNIVTIIMKEFGTDVNGAMLWTQDFHTELEQKFHAAMAALPEWDEPLNSQVKEYCEGMGRWVRGYDDWQFETKRYLGERGIEIKEKRWMSLMPKKRKDAIPGPVVVDSSLL